MLEKKNCDNIKITQNALLLIEGKDEVSFFGELFKYLNLQNVQFIDFGGKSKFKSMFDVLVADKSFNNVTKIAFIRDCDNSDIQSAFDSIKNIVLANNNQNNLFHNIIANCSLINNIVSDSTNTIKCGIYIMPDNKSTGMLEDLCLKTIEVKHESCCIDSFIKCLKFNNTFTSTNLSKSKFLSFLASKKDNPNSLGIATKQGYIDFSNQCFDGIKNFIMKVFA